MSAAYRRRRAAVAKSPAAWLSRGTAPKHALNRSVASRASAAWHSRSADLKTVMAFYEDRVLLYFVQVSMQKARSGRTAGAWSPKGEG